VHTDYCLSHAMKHSLGRLFVLFVAAFFTFFLGALTDQPFSGDNAFYASEIICRGPTSSQHCGNEASTGLAPFRGHIEEDKLQQFKNASYTSENFARLLRLSFDSDDSYREVIIKVFGLKSAIAAFTMLSIAILMLAYPYLHQTVIRMLAVAFSVPFLLETGAGFYPAAIATIALMPCLLVLEVFRTESSIVLTKKFLLYSLFVACASVVVSTRFETTAFLICACIVFVIRSWPIRRPVGAHRIGLIAPLATLTILAIGASVINSATAQVFREATSRQLFIVPFNTPARSIEIAERVGLPPDSAFSFMAPITMLDNSTRFFLNRTYGTLFQGSTISDRFNVLLSLIATILAWLPMLLVVGGLLIGVIRRMGRVLRQRDQPAASDIAQLVLFLLYFFIPYYARVVWSWWYLIPLLLVSVSLTSQEPLRRIESVAYLIASFNGVTSLVVVNWRLGDLHLGGFVTPIAILSSLSTLTTSLIFVVLYYGNRKSLIARPANESSNQL